MRSRAGCSGLHFSQLLWCDRRVAAPTNPRLDKFSSAKGGMARLDDLGDDLALHHATEADRRGVGSASFMRPRIYGSSERNFVATRTCPSSGSGIGPLPSENHPSGASPSDAPPKPPVCRAPSQAPGACTLDNGKVQYTPQQCRWWLTIWHRRFHKGRRCRNSRHRQSERRRPLARTFGRSVAKMSDWRRICHAAPPGFEL